MTTAAGHGGKTKRHSIADGHGKVDLDVKWRDYLAGRATYAPRGRVLGHVLRLGEPAGLLAGRQD